MVEKTVNDSWKVEQEEEEAEDLHDHEIAEEKSEYLDTLHVLYVFGFSEKLAKDVRNINVATTCSKGCFFFNFFFVDLNLPVHRHEGKCRI